MEEKKWFFKDMKNVKVWKVFFLISGVILTKIMILVLVIERVETYLLQEVMFNLPIDFPSGSYDSKLFV